MLEETGERLLQGQRKIACVVRHVIPGLDAAVARRKLGPLRHDAHLLLSGKPLLANGVPADVEFAPITLDELLRGLMRGMRRAQSEVQEEGLTGVDRLMIAKKSGGVVDEIFGQVIALFWASWRVNQVVVVAELRIELVGLSGEEPVVTIKASLQRPVVERSGLTHGVDRAEMPFPDREGRVVLLGEDLGHRCRVARDGAAHVREARIELSDGTHADGVMVASGQQ